MWFQLKALLPSFAMYWVFLTALFTVAWYCWTKWHPSTFRFHWKVPVLVATTAFMYLAGTSLFQLYQSAVLQMTAQQLQANEKQAAAPGQASQSSVAPQDPALKLKAEMLQAMEPVLKDPNAITPEFKRKFLADFAGVVPADPKKRTEYVKPVVELVQCQLYFWEDALASYKAKKVVKSESREECEKESGAFFAREKLIPEDMLKKNEEVLAKIAKHEPLTGPDGKPIEIKEQGLREAYELESRSKEAVLKLFN